MSEDKGDLVSWASAFKEKHGQPLRVLHIGNIANNAYINSKLLNEAGLDCDVICYDYYHIMGCPEWEDADFEGEIKDEFFPDWSKINLKGFKRPKWFAQGPVLHCINYLIARRKGNKLRAWFWWQRLEISRQPGYLKFINAVKFAILKVLGVSKTIIIAPLAIPIVLHWKVTGRTFNIGKRPKNPVMRKAFNLLNIILTKPNILLSLIMRKAFNLLNIILTKPNILLSLIGRRISGYSPEVGDAATEKRIGGLVKLFARQFKDREDKLTEADLSAYRSLVPSWRKLFEYYDIIQAYSTDPIIPLIANVKPYVAYEHGTIRDIPFETDARGRFTLLAYNQADVVYLTNADSLKRIKFIQKDSARVVFGLHGFDERRIEARLRNQGRLSGHTRHFGFSADTKLFFSPTRHHWHDGFPTWLKGNDRIIKAVKMLSRDYPEKFKVVFVEWGKEVFLSKRLIEELGIENFFHWVVPMKKGDLLNAYRNVDCILDQFVIPCIGGVAFEALSVAQAPLITYLDDDLLKEFYGETIPLFNCHSPEEIASVMEAILINPSLCAEKVKLCKEWMNRHHSHHVVVNTNLKAYRKIIGDV